MSVARTFLKRKEPYVDLYSKVTFVDGRWFEPVIHSQSPLRLEESLQIGTDCTPEVFGRRNIFPPTSYNYISFFFRFFSELGVVESFFSGHECLLVQ